MTLEYLHVLELSMDLSNKIWIAVLEQNHFESDTIGNPLVKSANLISANISEGHDRFSIKENKQFYNYINSIGKFSKNKLRNQKRPEWTNDKKYFYNI